MEVNDQLHAPAALPPGKQTLIPTGYEAGWAQSRYGRYEAEKNLLDLSLDTLESGE
jgi:hypothetical protein